MLGALLLTLAPMPAQTVTPAKFRVRVVRLELAAEDLEWVEVGVPAQSVQVDVASGAVKGLGAKVVPLGTYDRVRVSLGAVMAYETEDPCGGGGTVGGQVDWTGDPVIDPDGDRQWQLLYTTFESGGRATGDGSPGAPLLLDEPVRVVKGRNAPLRLVVGVQGLVRCDGGVVTVDRPSARMSVANSNATSVLAHQIWQVVGARLVDGGEGLTLSTLRGELAFQTDGRWTAPQVTERSLALASGEEGAATGPWGGWWSATEEGVVWLTCTGVDPPLRGWVDEDLQTFTLASTGAGEEAFVLWGVRRGATPPEQPYEGGARLVIHENGLELASADPPISDLSSWRLFTRFTGNWGYAGIDETAQRNLARIPGWIGGDPPGWPEVTSDWLPLHQGVTWTSQGASLALVQHDLDAAYEGYLAQDGSVAILGRGGEAAGRVGLGLTVQLASGLENSSVQGLEFHGAFLEDAVLGFEHRYSSGLVTLEFTSGVSCLLTTTHTGPGRSEARVVPGTYECWGEGRVVLHLADGRRYEGQVEPGLRTLALTSAEENGLGVEDRLIGLLVRP
jgi:hypothetical protein